MGESLRKGFSEAIVSELNIEVRLKMEEKKAKSPWIEGEAYKEFQMWKYWIKLQEQQVV